MDAEEAGAAIGREGTRRGGRGVTPLDRLAGRLPEEALARDRGEHRPPEGDDRIEAVEQLPVLRRGLPEPEAGVEHDRRVGDAGGRGRAPRGGKLRGDGADDIPTVVRVVIARER